MKECIKVGLLGAGTVGSGVLTVLEENTAEIEKKTVFQSMYLKF